MDRIDFCTMPVGEYEGARIAVCPECGRHGRVRARIGGGRAYDHVALPLEPAVAGVHHDIVDWCEVPESKDPATAIAARSTRARFKGVSVAFRIRRVEYFTTTVQDQPGEAYKLLSQLADLGLNLVAFTTVPVGQLRSQLTVFPEDPLRMAVAARKSGLVLDGPHPALLVQGDDELGALASIHAKIYEANVNVYASSGVADGRGSFGYVIYVRPEDYDRAAAALGI
jgi:hypothetical protein